MRFSRRAIISAGVALPLVPSLARAAQGDAPIDPLDTGDIRLLGISPDGSILVGIEGGEQLAFLETDSLKEIARNEPVTEIRSIAENSVVWSPDGRHLAFCIDAWVQARDSDIFVVDTETGEVRNLTGEGHEDEAESMLRTDGARQTDLQIDLYPVWLDDTTILFGRHTPPDSAPGFSCELITVDINTEEIKTWSALTGSEIQQVAGPIRLLDDHRVGFWAFDLQNQPLVTIADDAGAITLIDTGDLETPRLLDIDSAFAYVADARDNAAWRISVDSGEMESIFDVLGYERFTAQTSYPACGLEAGSFAIVAYQPQQDIEVLLVRESEAQVVGTLADFPPDAQCHWVQDRLLILSRDASWLIDLS